MSFDQDPTDQANISGADFAQMCDERERLKKLEALHSQWKWMTNPTRNDGEPIPVKFFTKDGVEYYMPFDERECTYFEVAEMAEDWKVVA